MSAHQYNIPMDHEKHLSSLLKLKQLPSHQRPIVIIGCGKQKATTTCTAENMYTSGLSRLSLAAAKEISSEYRILSAKYGLLCPADLISPYDRMIADLTPLEYDSLLKSTVDALREIPSDRSIIVLSGKSYYLLVLSAAKHTNHNIIYFFEGVSLGKRMSILSQFAVANTTQRNINRFYTLMSGAREYNNFFQAGTVLNNRIPPQGVYLFFDPAESVSDFDGMPRLVRVGTHAVSKGSKATLRTRLRAHIGTQEGAGNHRASIFRLHVGNAIIYSEGLTEKFPNWGKGSNASQKIKASERPLEKRVSEYISRLQVAYFEVGGSSMAGNNRSKIERGLISLFSNFEMTISDISPSWLGQYSPSDDIRHSGLWNINHVRSGVKKTDVELALLHIQTYYAAMGRR